MGIQGCTVAVDAYCWLHKGVFICADKLARGEDNLAYVNYCMRYVTMLLSKNIKPILVFDGQHLPAKAETESKRRMLRDQNKKKAAELLRLDRGKEAISLLKRSVDVTHKMALNLIKQCREINVDCIVAPYEADPQLAYLNISGIAHLVITEDSDLLLFGCKKVLFKMDQNGGGLLIEQDKLYLSMNIRPDQFTMDKFRYMCILSGCDYLPSISGVGLSKARQFITRISEPDIYKALIKLGPFLNIKVPLEYRDQFLDANCMFLYQPIYDPLSRKIKPLNEIPDSQKSVLSSKLTNSEAFQLAIGNVDPISLHVMDDWNPDVKQNFKKSSLLSRHKSIWSQDFQSTELNFGSSSSTSLNNLCSIPTRAKISASSPTSKTFQKFSNTSSILTKKIPVNESDILNTLEEIYETEKTEINPVLKIKKSPIMKSERNNEHFLININTKLNSKNKEYEPEVLTGLKKLAKRKYTVLNTEKEVVSGYFSSQGSTKTQNYINPFKCRKIDESIIKISSNSEETNSLCLKSSVDEYESKCDNHIIVNNIEKSPYDDISQAGTNSIKSDKINNFNQSNIKEIENLIFDFKPSLNSTQSIIKSPQFADNDVDEGFCSQTAKVSFEMKPKIYSTPKNVKQSYPRQGLSKNSIKTGQTLLSKFGFKTADQLKP
ncbi:exonuclease 1 isoform X2 [Daktulosphaira vitifoliae]|uniref:exonuclease 1 isoform X2 n=1 Tax=Daktulosphaira vitifoliae TaxID=58002 RepID=UPI0021A9CCC4|nr:exonuclease 1 isoform X2 [Daktulosphaira vitifoliae]